MKKLLHLERYRLNIKLVFKVNYIDVACRSSLPLLLHEVMKDIKHDQGLKLIHEIKNNYEMYHFPHKIAEFSLKLNSVVSKSSDQRVINKYHKHLQTNIDRIFV